MLALHLNRSGQAMPQLQLFFLHALGASAGEWERVIARLGDRADCIALDIPGFGGTSAGECTDVPALVDWFCATVAARAPSRWCVVGHSMGGKIATLAAARAREGAPGLAGLCGVVLVAASPPSLEPMEQQRRQQMLDWFADGAPTPGQAAQFVDDNSARRLDEAPREQAIADVRRSDPRAWRAWLEQGSKQDASAQAGRIALPALLLAGAEDGDLDADAQRRLNLPHYPEAGEVVAIADAAHLIPYEQPEALAAHIDALLQWAEASALPPAFIDLLNLPRVQPRMRATLLARHRGPPRDAPRVLSDAQRAVLAAVVASVLALDDAPQAADLARRLDVGLATQAGDGWRFADLPADAQAWPLGLDALDAMTGGWCARDPLAQEAWLTRIARGDAQPGPQSALDGAQLARWFEDVRAEIARTWASLPATMAAMGYDGFATGSAPGEGEGYVLAGADQREPWQRLPDPRE
nr:alpha/beta hydrolase [Pseudoxanthomonas winnipegensis]